MTNFKNVLMVLSMSLGLAACHPEDEKDEKDEKSTIDAGAAAVGGAALFRGVWKYESLTARMTCSDGTEETSTEVSGTETFTQGDGPDQIIGVDEDGGRSVCQVSGNIANCQTVIPSGENYSITVVQDVYTYANGKLAESSAFEVALADGGKCAVVGTATLGPVK